MQRLKGRENDFCLQLNLGTLKNKTMLGLGAFGRKPRGFNYRPLHYDPQQEAREQRKRELLGDDYDKQDDQQEEYKAGSYIRQHGFSRKSTQMTERGLSGEQRKRNVRRGLIALFLLFVIAIYLMS